MSHNLMAVLFALSAACAAQKPQQKTAAKTEAQYSSAGQPKPKGVMRCQMEQETGSNRMERVCSYEDKNDLGDSSIDDAMIRAQQRAAQHQDPGQNAGGH